MYKTSFKLASKVELQKGSIDEPWGIYVHVPWCHRRCSYCDFYFEIGKSNTQFAEILQKEWQTKRAIFPNYPAKTLYFGGGTPSVLPVSQIEYIVLTIKNDLQDKAEITLEANPEDLELPYLIGLKEAGINRLSLGVQSFDDAILKWLGRKHTTYQAKECIQKAQLAGFNNLSVDLIVGVPNENWKSIKDSINWLAENQIKHISVYLLTVEPQTPLWRMIKKGSKTLPIDDEQAAVYENVQEYLAQSGFCQYEISSFAMPGFESQHNRLYWAKGSYLGLGPGAHSMILKEDGSITRWHSKARLAEWLRAPLKAEQEEEILMSQQAFLESMAFGIRDIAHGIDVNHQLLRHKCQLPKDFLKAVAYLKNEKWIVEKEGSLFLTQIGAKFADAVSREFLGIS